MQDSQQSHDESLPVQGAEHAERLVRMILNDMPVETLRQLVVEMEEMIAKNTNERS